MLPLVVEMLIGCAAPLDVTPVRVTSSLSVTEMKPAVADALSEPTVVFALILRPAVMPTESAETPALMSWPAESDTDPPVPGGVPAGRPYTNTSRCWRLCYPCPILPLSLRSL